MQPRDRAPYSAIVDRPPLSLPGGAPRDRLDHRQPRGVGHRPPHGAPNPPAADRPDPPPRRPQLELARIRHARRRLALLRPLRPPRHPPHALHQRPRLRRLRARRRRGPRRRLGVHGPVWDQVPIHKLDDQRATIHALDASSKLHRQAPNRLARPRPDQTSKRPNSWPRPESSTSATGSGTTSPSRSTPRTGPLVTLPYTVELNDIPTMVVQHHESPDWLTRCRDSFDRL